MAKFLMIQGTSSGVGKSLMVSALCRIFARKGISVAPFKAQNMSLNSGVSIDGKEMGRAQIVQAIAAMRPPEVLMNPILLKPEGDTRSQLVILGEVRGSIGACEYYDNGREDLWKVVSSALIELSKKVELVIIEGAGSPAEINLMDKDIVNMRVARFVSAPVLLVGDIERGGVFASIYGTVSLLGEDAKYIKGFIINRFRGDLEVLRPGLVKLEGLTGRPVVGVVPYVRHMIDEEDSISERIAAVSEKKGELKIGVVRLPFMSNYTDFSPLEKEEDVALFYFDPVFPPDDVDMVILPGSKNTIKDVRYLKDVGFDRWLNGFRDRGGVIVGICGGYQMLGRSIRDPHGVEGGGCIECLGLLDVDTILECVKSVYLVRGKWLDGTEIYGYEIHMGKTSIYSGKHPLLRITMRNGVPVNLEDGVSSSDGLVWGTYIHGIFDSGIFRRKYLNDIRVRKGLLPLQKDSKSWIATLDEEIDRFAGIVEDALDMKMVEKIIGGYYGF